MKIPYPCPCKKRFYCWKNFRIFLYQPEVAKDLVFDGKDLILLCQPEDGLLSDAKEGGDGGEDEYGEPGEHVDGEESFSEVRRQAWKIIFFMNTEREVIIQIVEFLVRTGLILDMEKSFLEIQSTPGHQLYLDLMEKFCSCVVDHGQEFCICLYIIVWHI